MKNFLKLEYDCNDRLFKRVLGNVKRLKGFLTQINGEGKKGDVKFIATQSDVQNVKSDKGNRSSRRVSEMIM